MYAQLRNNIVVNFKFYKRNKLVLTAAIFIFLGLGLSFIPSMFFLTKTQHLAIVTSLFSQLSTFSTLITAALGLLLISQHLRNRSTKMIFTKPCSPEIWLLSSFLSASAVCLALYLGILFICSTLFVVWNIPFQWGIAYVAINDFIQAIILLSYITFLAVVFHPVSSVLFLLVFQDSTFYFLKMILMSKIKELGEHVSPWLRISEGFIDSIYMTVPTLSPYSSETSSIYSSLRVSNGNWKYLFLALAYTLVISTLFYLLAVYFLKKKRHI